MFSIPDALDALVLKSAAYKEDSRDRDRHLDDAARDALTIMSRNPSPTQQPRRIGTIRCIVSSATVPHRSTKRLRATARMPRHTATLSASTPSAGKTGGRNSNPERDLATCLLPNSVCPGCRCAGLGCDGRV
ncbi:hypothetical protein BST25_20270 [Mycobacterium heidelbergense]|uniref:Uncharacterized protein n=1 Tax=Mycobacterium heidelbergense TaxID=53376 RepID=A0A1X0DDX2_MYCHE|nr:hypothetical protein BST25_20270 [Mycobacterium heidelbergense]